LVIHYKIHAGQRKTLIGTKAKRIARLLLDRAMNLQVNDYG
jgi:hypothetical protein